MYLLFGYLAVLLLSHSAKCKGSCTKQLRQTRRTFTSYMRRLEACLKDNWRVQL